MCKFFGGCEPDDPRIEKMDPARRMWMYYNWIEDQRDDVELAKNHAYLLGSFWNPEAAAKLSGEGGAEVHVSSDEEFDELSERLLESNRQEAELKKGRRRQRRKLKKSE